MTSIEYGGGPNLEQKKKFCDLEDGGHVPGYMGFCPQFKYKNGKSFGKQTAEIAHELPYYNGPQSQKEHHLYPVIGNQKDSLVRSVFKDEVPGRLLPKPTGDNKYTEGMIPGYSGDVPHMNFKFGATYTKLSDDCVDEFIRQYRCTEKREEELKEIARLFPTLRPISKDPYVRDHLNTWTDNMIKVDAKINPVKGPTEPPIPGYEGFIPRVQTTDAGLSSRFHEAAHKGLEIFRNECKSHYDRLNEPMTSIDKSLEPRGVNARLPNDKYYSSRIFRQEGMIPDYYGHVHGYKYEIGQNFGNTTRGLEVCSHPYPNYGEFTKSRDYIQKYLPNS